ncbi:MAG: hypothetical protein V1685_07265 [Parcubacteria group bacterium]
MDHVAYRAREKLSVLALPAIAPLWHWQAGDTNEVDNVDSESRKEILIRNA